MIIELNQNTINEAKQSEKPVIIDVYAEWCPPCKAMKPIFEEVAQEHSDDYMFATLNVDEARELAMTFGVTSIPTFIFMKDGAIKGKVVGALSKEQLIAKMREL